VNERARLSRRSLAELDLKESTNQADAIGCGAEGAQQRKA
jgi:hypothetical protein